MLDLRLISIWEAIRRQNTYVNYHSHKYHELVYYTTGNGKTEIHGKMNRFSDGDGEEMLV